MTDQRTGSREASVEMAGGRETSLTLALTLACSSQGHSGTQHTVVFF